MRKPSTVIFGVDDIPPLGVITMSGFQHVGLMAINLVYPVLVARAAGATVQVTAAIVSLTLLALAVGTVLQVIRIGPVGSGYLCQPVPTVVYLIPSLIAARQGGLPLVFGMTLAAGVFEAALAGGLRRLRPLFPPEIAGLVVLLIGVATGMVGLRTILEGAHPGSMAPPSDVALALATLATMAALNVWGSRAMRMTCVLIGMICGYVIAAVAARLAPDSLSALAESSYFALPGVSHLGWAFNGNLALPFAVAAVAATLKVVGNVTTCQKSNDADWIRADMRSISRGVLADGLATVVAGGLGSQGLNSATMNVGLATATGVQSRRIAYAIAVILVVLALIPKLGVLLYLMPRPVAGAALVFAATFIMVNGLQIIATRLLDSRRTLVIGLAMIAGFAADRFPEMMRTLLAGVPAALGSSLVAGTMVGLILNLLFRMGVRQTGTLSIRPAVVDADAIEEFMERQGQSWGARRDVIDRAMFNLTQSIETIIDGCAPQGPLDIEATFDEFNLDIRVTYSGPLLELPEHRPSNEEIMESEEGERRLAGFMLRRFADRVAVTHKAGRSTILFHFDH